MFLFYLVPIPNHDVQANLSQLVGCKCDVGDGG